ncbi:Na(+)/H(+) antiporter subunit C [Tsukamurella soli]|uniref:Na(+)/H(+) antiporter subunit C n=1 Tax=Tsukamurella soli TaxID=644556 RepID=A0ABP8JW28_9ACTN
MSLDVGLYLAIGVLVATGVYLLLDRSLTRMLMGLLLAGNGVNLLLLVLASPPGRPPIAGFFSAGRITDADPLAQALILTAIVITMGMSAFILALAYRSFTINTDDEVDDDPEDTRIRIREAPAEAPDYDASDDPVTGAPSPLGDAFGPDGHRLTDEELRLPHVDALDTDALRLAELEWLEDRDLDRSRSRRADRDSHSDQDRKDGR